MIIADSTYTKEIMTATMEMNYVITQHVDGKTTKDGANKNTKLTLLDRRNNDNIKKTSSLTETLSGRSKYTITFLQQICATQGITRFGGMTPTPPASVLGTCKKLIKRQIHLYLVILATNTRSHLHPFP